MEPSPKLKFVCPAKWDNMRITVLGRHCAQCDKQVVDFTKGSKQDIIDHLRASTTSVCGRVRSEHVDHYEESMEVVIHRKLRSHARHNPALILLAATGLALSSCTGEQSQHQRTATTQNAGDTSDGTTDTDPQDPTDPIGTTTGDADIDYVPFVGELMIPEPYPPDTTPVIYEVAPIAEFPGGQDSLYAFLRKHFTYPEWESENKIEGRVYVQFTVTKDGSVEDPKILRSVPGSKNMDAEVLRVIGLLPRFQPAEIDGDAVDSKYTLPINFKLDAG